jgi:hypothetical protein
MTDGAFPANFAPERRRLDPYEVPPPDSCDAARLVHSITDDHLGIMVEIVCLEREAETLPREGRAGAVVSRVVADLCAVRDAAGAVVLDASAPELAVLFEPDAPLGVYLGGLLLWTRGVLSAMRAMCASVAAGRPAWISTRRRLDRAGAMHLAGLADDSLSHVENICRGAHAESGAHPSPIALESLVSFQRVLRGLMASADELARNLRDSFTVTPAE